MLTHTLYIDKPNTITRKCYPQINYPKHNWLFSFFSAIKIISSIVPPLVFISDRDIEHITGSVFNVCLRGVNIAGWNVTGGDWIRAVHGMSKRLAEHYRSWPMMKRRRYGVRHERVSGGLCWVRRVTNISASVQVVVVMVTVTSTKSPAFGHVTG